MCCSDKTRHRTSAQELMHCMWAAAKVGTYSIVTLVNGAASGNTTHPAIAGGMQWYVDQVLGNSTYGSGGSYNLFYTDTKVKQVQCSNPHHD